MANLAEIRNRDDRLSRVTRDSYLHIAQALQGTIFEKTAAVLSSLVAKLGSLKTGILNLGEADNLYSMYVLFRVFLEHLLRANAIFLVSARDHSDSIAREYLRLYIPETFEYLKAYEAAGLDLGNSLKSQLDQWIPEASGLSAKEVGKIAAPFRYRNLIQTIRKEIKADAPNFLSKIIPNYSQLSAFVHGGPSADDVLVSFEDATARYEEIVRVVDLTVSMFYSAERWLLLLASSVRPELEALYNALDQQLDSAR